MSYSSMSTTKNNTNFTSINPPDVTDHDREIEATLIDADEEPVSYTLTFNRATLILAMLCQGYGWNLGEQYEPDWFEDDGHKKIFKIQLENWTNHQQVLTKEVLQEVIKERYGDNPHTLQVLGETEEIYNDRKYNVASQTALEEIMTNFAKEQSRLMAIGEIHKLLKGKKSKHDKIDEKIDKVLDTLRSKKFSKSDPVMTWDEMEKLADEEEANEQWIVQDLLQTRSLNMTSGRSFSGKTTLIYKAIACICEGKDFLGHSTTPVAICYLNCDRNKVRRIRRKVKNNMTVANPSEMLRKKFFPIHLDCLPTTLTKADLKRYESHLRKRIGKDIPILFIIDTFRSAFLAEAEQGTTNDDTAIVGLLTPIQQWCVESNNAVWLIHHNTKSVDDYTGSSAFLQLLETKMNYKRNEEDPVGELHIITRDDFLATYFIRLDDQKRPYRTDTKGDDEELQKVANSFGSGASIANAFKVYQDNLGQYKETKFKEMVKVCDMATPSMLVIKEKGNGGNKPAIYALPG
jgi:AAA domain